MRKRYIMLVCLVLWSCVWASLSFARGLYSTSVFVQNQSLAARDAALAQAAAEVLRNVSGNARITENSDMQKALMHASEWVESYAYTAASTGTRAALPWVFQVNFSEKKIDTVIKLAESGAKTPATVSTKPELAKAAVDLDQQAATTKASTLLFLVVNPASGKKYLLSESNSTLAKEIKTRALQKNLKILLPLLDLEEHSMVDINTVLQVMATGKIEEGDVGLRKMLQRYMPRAVVFATLTSINNKQWKSQWFVINHVNQMDIQNNQSKQAQQESAASRNNYSHEERWAFSSASLPGQLSFFTQSLLNLQRVNKLQLSESPQAMLLRISGIQDAGEYHEILSYLKNMQGMLQVKPVMITMDEIAFNILWDGPIAQLQSSLRQDKFLVKTKAAHSPLTEGYKYDESVVLFYSRT